MNTDSENPNPEFLTQEPAEAATVSSAESAPIRKRAEKAKKKPRRVLVIDVGGTHVKVLASGEKERREIPSGPKLTAAKMAQQVKNLVKDWKYDAVTIGYPGPVVHGRPLREPHNLGPGWVKFNYNKAFGCPVRILNDAAMQALGSYKKGTYEDYLGLRGLERLGKKKWRREVAKVAALLREALEANQVVLGGGNAAKLKELLPNTKLGNNNNAFLGGFRVWEDKGITLGT